MDRDVADEIIQRAGVLAVMYYPEIHADDPDYTLSSDVAWILEPAAGLPQHDRDQLQELLSRVIIDPTGYREELTDTVYGLVPDATQS